ncbi:MAG TPA: class I SAM-dependent methyltransferase [Burkholderiales bacterium]|nr:class I SAM-dependent methyltransferase [Burkholderiales bacterium]
MTPETYALAAQAEEEHWWFSARRSILRAVLDRYLAPASDRALLELGCGNGGNLALLARYGKLCAVEMDDGARRRAAARGIAAVEPGALPDAIPFAGQQFDVVAALDVLEHVADDRAALAAMRAKLKRGGYLLLTVPAFRWLWSRHDEASRHQRRYSKGELVRLVESAGFEVTHSTYFNTLLFPLAVAYIKLSGRVTADADHGLRIPPRPLNALLRGIFSAERHLVPKLALPFGVSILLCGIAK